MHMPCQSERVKFSTQQATDLSAKNCQDGIRSLGSSVVSFYLSELMFVTVGMREFATVGIRIFNMQTCSFCSGFLILPTMLYFLL